MTRSRGSRVSNVRPQTGLPRLILPTPLPGAIGIPGRFLRSVSATSRISPVAGPRWLLLGDAAGLVDPLTREGIFYALLSGEMAARSITEAAGNPGRSYRAQLTDSIVPELRRAAALKGAFFNAGFSRLVVQALAQSVAIRAVMVDLVGGRQPYIGLRRRLLSTWEPAWALRALTHEFGTRLKQTVASDQDPERKRPIR